MAQYAFLDQTDMTKKLITDALIEATSMRHKDADVLASLILVTIRDEIIKEGEVRLPGIGTFLVGDSPTRLSKKDVANAVYRTGIVNRQEAFSIASAMLDYLKGVVASSSCVALHGIGEISVTEPTTSISKRTVRFRASPYLTSDEAQTEVVIPLRAAA